MKIRKRKILIILLVSLIVLSSALYFTIRILERKITYGIDNIQLQKKYFSYKPPHADKIDISVAIPDGFKIMSKEMMESKYALREKPIRIYTNEQGDTNVSFVYTNSNVENGITKTYEKGLKDGFSSLYPTAKWFDDGILEINSRKFGYFELMTPAIDTDIYNYMFFTDINNKLLIITFNTTREEMLKWQGAAKIVIMPSVEIN